MSERAAARDELDSARHIPGEAGIWVFVLGDMSVFAVIFGTFLFYRTEDPALYIRSQGTLNQTFGVVNTLLLLASSWFVALGVSCAREHLFRLTPRLFGLAFLCGAGFVGVKYLEYGEKLAAGITLTTNAFYSFYYVLTGLHLLHVTIGMAILAVMIAKARVPAGSRPNLMLFESGATYWHMVDVLWIVLFPLLYLLK